MSSPKSIMTDVAPALSGVKRPAEDPPAPAMAKEEAARIVAAITPPKPPKSKSDYVRFKSLLLKDAKDRGDKEAAKNITAVAKTAWDKVKNTKISTVVLSETTETSHQSDNQEDETRRLLRLKAQAIKDESDEKEAYASQVRAFVDKFRVAAEAHLHWAMLEAQDADAATVSTLEGVIRAVASKTGTTCTIPALFEANEKLKSLQMTMHDRNLCDKLRQASDEELLQHVQEYRTAVAAKAQLDKIHAQQAVEHAQKKQAEERELDKAHKIEDEICKNLKSQMVYTNSSLKYSSKKISYRRGGVSPAVFCAAFGVAKGTKKATISGYSVGTKSLRYGSCLVCNEVTVKLVGEDVVATTTYTLER